VDAVEPSTDRFAGDLRGRAGLITYSAPPRRLEIHWERSGSPEYDILVVADFRSWTSDPKVAISEQQQLEILAALREWLRARQLRSDIDLPLDIAEDKEACLSSACERRRISGHAYCRYHYDLSCLRS
jgi:hypothetical protein